MADGPLETNGKDQSEKVAMDHLDHQEEDGAAVDGRIPLHHKIISFVRTNLLLVLLMSSLVLGITVGFCVRLISTRKYTDSEITYILFPGTLFLNMLSMIIIPLIVSSLIVGMASLDKQASGKLGMRTIIYYFGTTLLAVILGIILVTTIRPGVNREKDDIIRTGEAEEVNTVDAFLDLIRNMFPPNIIEACFRVYKTHQVKIGETTPAPDVENISSFVSEDIFEAKGGFEYKSNILGLVVFSVAFGVVLGRLGEEGDALRELVNSLFATVMVLVKGIIWLSPIGVFFLVIGRILEMDNWVDVFTQIGMYSVTVMMGLFIHGLLVLPSLYLLFTRQNPYYFLKGIFPAVVTAFATSSSSATLPLTITCLENNNKVDPRVTRFVLPVGATINMDGTALYEAVAAIFIAQVNDYNLGFKDILTISITATLASVGAAGVPQAGLITLVIVLNAVGLPAEDVTLIIVIDWFLDRIRTAINVEGDSIGAGIIARFSKDDLAKLEHVVTSADGYAMVNANEEGQQNQTGNQTAL